MSSIKQIQQVKNRNWYMENKNEFLQNKKDDYNNYYKYYYKIRLLLKKYPEVVIPTDIMNMKIENNDFYKKKYILIKTVIDNFILSNINQSIIEVPNQKRRTYKKQLIPVNN